MLQAHSLLLILKKDGNPNTWFSTKTQISAVQEGETSAIFWKEQMKGRDDDDRQNA